MPFCKAITIAQWRVPKTDARFSTASEIDIKNDDVGDCSGQSAGHEQQRRWERGRRRTRQDQISLGLKIAGEIAELGESAPNEEN